MPIPEMTYEIAHAAGQDAGNRSMRKAGRTSWDREDFNIAAKEFSRLMPSQITHFNEHPPKEK
jgi:hypothetical protein